MLTPQSSTRLLMAALGVAVVVAPAVASAHDIWITIQPKGKMAVADIAFGDTDDRQVAETDKIVAFQVVGAGKDLRRPLQLTTFAGAPVLETPAMELPKGSVLALTYDNGFWIKIPGDPESTNTTKLFAPGGTNARWTVKYAKTLYGKGAYAHLVNSRIEMIPLKDPYDLKAGEPLPVKVVLDGKPVADTEIQYADGVAPLGDAKSPKIKTGADGIANVPMTGSGPQLLVADVYTDPTDHTFSDKDHLYASLAFDLKQ